MKLMHLITDLETGGAEVVLSKLLAHMDRSRFQNSVVSMTNEGVLGGPLKTLGIPVFTLRMRPGMPHLLALWRFVRLLRKERPMLLQTWLYHADLLGLLAGKLARVPVIVWNVRCSDMDMRYYSKLSALVFRMVVALSSVPQAVIVNSEAGRQFHERLGYTPRRWVYIPNGFDLARFCPDAKARGIFRRALSLPNNTILIGLVARFDPMKDHTNFLRAAHCLLKKDARVHFVLVGRGVDHNNQEMMHAIQGSGYEKHFHLLGEQKDMPLVFNALDLLCSSSAYGEGFSNAIGEAMACGVPCVVTDVGDSAHLVGDTGKVVSPKNPEALADAWQQLIALGEAERRECGMAARCRIEKNFSLPAMAARYEQFYETCFT